MSEVAIYETWDGSDYNVNHCTIITAIKAKDNVMITTTNQQNIIREWRYSVSDVVFGDVGDTPVPDEYQHLFDEYCAEIDILPVDTPMWRCATPEFKNVMLEKHRHIAYTKFLLCSGDAKKIRAAEEAMLNQLGRYYESQQQKEHVEECRKNLVKARQEGRWWTLPNQEYRQRKARTTQ